MTLWILSFPRVDTEAANTESGDKAQELSIIEAISSHFVSRGI